MCLFAIRVDISEHRNDDMAMKGVKAGICNGVETGVCDETEAGGQEDLLQCKKNRSGIAAVGCWNWRRGVFRGLLSGALSRNGAEVRCAARNCLARCQSGGERDGAWSGVEEEAHGVRVHSKSDD